MVNLRPRAPQFDPFRRIQPVGGGGADTYQRADVDSAELNRSLGLLQSVRQLSPSVERFLDQAQKTFLGQTQDQAQALVADMTPEQARAESVKSWEAYSKDSKIDNVWWRIFLDEATGQRLGLEFDERLTSRLQEATDPANPQAHLRIVQEERARLTEGMGHFARSAFEEAVKPVTQRFVIRAAEEREARFQAQMGESYKSTVQSLVRQSLDPALGGAVDLGRLMEVVEKERQRSGNTGREEVLQAVDNAIGIQVAQADTPEQLDAVRVQVASLLADLGGQAFGPDAQTLEDSDALKLDALQEASERILEARERQLRERGNEDEREANEDMNDAAFALAAKVFNREITASQANEQLAEAAGRIAGEYGADRDAVYGRGLVMLRSQASALEGTRFSRSNDWETALALEDYLGAPDFNPATFSEMLAGAVERGALTEESYGSLLRRGGDARTRAIEGVAADRVDAAVTPLATRLIEVQAAPFLDQILDPIERDRVQGWMAGELKRVSVAERGRLAGLIQQHGPNQAQRAADEWGADFAERSASVLSGIVAGARERFAGEVAADPRAAFRSQVQGSRAYAPARQRFIQDWLRERFAGDPNGADALRVAINPGLANYPSDDPVADLAAMVAGGDYNDSSGQAFDLFREGEAALMGSLEEGQTFDAADFDVRRASAAAEARLRDTLTAPPPKPAARPNAGPSVGDAEARATIQKAEGGEALAAATAKAASAAQTAEAARGAPDQFRQIAEAEAREAEAERRRARSIAWESSHNLQRTITQRLSTVPGSVLREEDRLQVQNGRLWPAGAGLRDPQRALAAAQRLEGQFILARLHTGLTLKEVQEGKAIVPVQQMIGEGEFRQAATVEQRINLDMGLVKPTTVPFFGSVAELESADLTEWLRLFPAYSAEAFKAAQRQVILERIPEPQTK